MEYSAFISYRRGGNQKTMESIARKFKELLCSRLRLKDKHHQVYLDLDDKERGLEKSLATNLCNSGFLIVLYHRPYCQYEDKDNPWCLRELITFEEKAAKREQFLVENDLHNVKMLIPILIDDEEIQPKCFENVFSYTLDLTPIKPFNSSKNIKTIQKIVDYIHAKRDSILKSTLREQLFEGCDKIDKLVDADHHQIVSLMERFNHFDKKSKPPKWS